MRFEISVHFLLGAELREIQKQIDNLPRSTEPQTVAEFMRLRRDVMFLEFDTAVRHCMADTFLSTGNIQAYKVDTAVWLSIFKAFLLTHFYL